MSGMRVLLTGGTGFVGINIAEALCRRGDEVVIYAPDTLPEAAAAALSAGPGKYRVVTGDVRDEEAITAALAGCKAVIHAAAVTRGPEREIERAGDTITINTVGTARTLAAAMRAGVRRFVALSSSSVYGANANLHPRLSEDDPRPRCPTARTRSPSSRRSASPCAPVRTATSMCAVPGSAPCSGPGSATPACARR